MDSNGSRILSNSKSMPLLPSYTTFGVDQEQRVESPWAQVLHEIQCSPNYQLLIEDDTPASAPLQRDAAELPLRCPPTPENNEDSAMSSPSSDETIKPRREFRADADHQFLAPQIHDAQAAREPGLGEMGDKYVIRDSAHSAQVYPFHTTVPGIRVEPSKATWVDVPHKDGPLDHSGNLLQQKTAPSDNPFVSTSRSNRKDFGVGTMTLNDNTHAGSWSAYDSSPGTPTAHRSLHHRHGSSNFSFVPVEPSKLGPGHFVDDLGSDVSGLVSPAPAQSQYAKNLHTRQAVRPKLPALHLPQTIPTSWTRSTSDSYSPFDMSAANDPFLDHTSHRETPLFGYSSHGYKASTPTTPRNGHSFQQEPHPLNHFSPQNTFQSEPPRPPTNSPPKDVNPTPRPPLLDNQSIGHSDTQASARLHAHKSLRHEWIQKETRNLVAAGRAFASAKEQYGLTGTAEDYKAMLDAEAHFQETWSLGRLTEGRRNLTLPEGMRAMKTGPQNLPEDGMAGGGGLLGSRMALMERVCTEVVAGREENDNNDGKVDMESLDPYAKKAIRKAVVKDVKGWTEKRELRREGEGEVQGEEEGRAGEFQP